MLALIAFVFTSHRIRCRKKRTYSTSVCECAQEVFYKMRWFIRFTVVFSLERHLPFLQPLYFYFHVWWRSFCASITEWGFDKAHVIFIYILVGIICMGFSFISFPCNGRTVINFAHVDNISILISLHQKASRLNTSSPHKLLIRVEKKMTFLSLQENKVVNAFNCIQVHSLEWHTTSRKLSTLLS